MNMNKISNNVPAIQTKSEQTQVHIQNVHKRTPRNLQHKESNNNVANDINKQDVKTTVEKLNDFIDPLRTNLKFVFHEELHEYYVTVVDPLTNEVLREIPPKKMLDMYAAMTEFMDLLVDEKI